MTDIDTPRVPVIASKSKGDAEFVEAFKIGRKTWRIRASATPNEVLGYFAVQRTRGNQAANEWLLSTLLEDGAYTALLSCGGLTNEDVEALMRMVGDALNGGVKTPNS